jgi:subtilisin family serine protease
VSVFADDRFVVKVDGDVTQVARRHNLSVVKSLIGSGAGVHVLSSPRGSDPRNVLQSLSQEASVRAAEKEKPLLLPGVNSKNTLNPSGSRLAPPVRLDGTPVFYYNSFAAASYVNQQAGAVINLAQAHGLADGNGAKVAVLDTGIDRFHPVLFMSVGEGYDFVRNVGWTGGQEQIDTNQETTPILDQETTPILDQETTPILDGGSALILRQETTPILDQETTPILDSKKYPAYGHGTMVAGLIHLVAPRAKLLPVRVFGANGAATISQVVAGIYWAVDHGADVINMSFSTTQDSPQLSAAVDYAIKKGVVLVAAAGNDGKATQVWPASYSNVIGVASTNNSLIRSLFSNFGAPLVSLAAPGEADVTVYPGRHYAQVWGTSFSTPLAAGGAALLFDITKRTDGAAAEKALSQAKFIGQELGAGELDLYQACQYAKKK